MKTTLKDLYLIDPNLLSDRITHLENLRTLRNNQSQDLDFFEIQLLKNLQDTLTPLEPILKDCFDSGIDAGASYPQKHWNKYRKEFLAKPHQPKNDKTKTNLS